MDESALRILEVALYHYRRIGDNGSVPFRSTAGLKINRWGAISTSRIEIQLNKYINKYFQ